MRANPEVEIINPPRERESRQGSIARPPTAYSPFMISIRLISPGENPRSWIEIPRLAAVSPTDGRVHGPPAVQGRRS